jgi:hypothetical protein
MTPRCSADFGGNSARMPRASTHADKLAMMTTFAPTCASAPGAARCSLTVSFVAISRANPRHKQAVACAVCLALIYMHDALACEQLHAKSEPVINQPPSFAWLSVTSGSASRG